MDILTFRFLMNYSMDNSNTEPSSAAPVKDEIRTCSHCRHRISSRTFDPHSLCATCRGGECKVGSKCNECMLWSDDTFDIYVKHRASLDANSKACKLRKSL